MLLHPCVSPRITHLLILKSNQSHPRVYIFFIDLCLYCNFSWSSLCGLSSSRSPWWRTGCMATCQHLKSPWIHILYIYFIIYIRSDFFAIIIWVYCDFVGLFPTHNIYWMSGWILWEGSLLGDSSWGKKKKKSCCLLYLVEIWVTMDLFTWPLFKFSVHFGFPASAQLVPL